MLSNIPLVEHTDKSGELRMLIPLHKMEEHLKLTVGPFYGDANNGSPPILTKDQIKPFDFPTDDMPAVKDQDGIGACNAFDTINVTEFTRAREGLPYVKLSPGYLYGNINGGRDQGSSLQDALNWMLKIGTVPATEVGELVWQKQKWKKDQPTLKSLASPYRLLEVWRIPNTLAAFSAAYEGFIISTGVVWHQGDSDVGGDGILPVNGGKQLGGHAFCAYGIEGLPNGDIGLRCRNQWGTSYGLGGDMVMPYQRVDLEMQNNFGWWACRQTVFGAENLKPPVK